MTHSTSKKHIVEDCVIRENVSFVTSILSIDLNAPHSNIEESVRAIYAEMLQSGSKGYTREEMMHALNILGASISIHADDTYLRISLKARNEVLPKVLPLLTAILTAPTWNQKELLRIKEHLVNQLILSKEDARERATQRFINEFVSETDWRFNYEVDTYIKAVRSVRMDDLKKLHKKISTSSWTHTVGGTKEVCAKVSRTISILGENAEQSVKEVISPVSIPTHTTLTLLDIPHKQNIEFSIGGALPILINDSAFVPLHFGLSVLGLYGGFTGRLMSTVREKEGLTYMIYGRVEDITRYTEGYWRIATFFAPKDAEKGIELTVREISHISNTGVTTDELKRFKAILKTRHILAEDSLLRMVSDRHMRTISGISEAQYIEMFLHVQNLTLDEVNTTLKKYLNPKALVISGAGPVSSIEKSLKAQCV